MSKVPSYKQLFLSTGVFGGAQVFTLLAALVRSKVAAEYIGAVGIGLNSLYNVVATFVSTLSNMGINTSAIKLLSEKYENSNSKEGKIKLNQSIAKVRILGIIFALIGAIGLIVFSPILSRIYFDDYSQLFQFASLSIVVFASVVSGVELAVMRATRHLKSVVATTLFGALLSVSVIVPIYIFVGNEGVIWAFVLSSFISFIVITIEGLRVNRWMAISLGLRRLVSEMKGMLMLGIAFMASGVVANAVDLSVQSYFSKYAGLDVLGMYRAGFQISVTYIGMVFAAIGNDYYPRLAAICDSVGERNMLISRQIKVLLSVTLPLVMVFVLIAPLVIEILYNNDFSPIIDMVRWASVGIIAKSFYLPLEFVLLAKGKSVQFLIMEIINNVIMGVATIVGYQFGGYLGIGIGILVSQVVEAIWVAIFLRKAYDVRVNIFAKKSGELSQD